MAVANEWSFSNVHLYERRANVTFTRGFHKKCYFNFSVIQTICVLAVFLYENILLQNRAELKSIICMFSLYLISKTTYLAFARLYNNCRTPTRYLPGNVNQWSPGKRIAPFYDAYSDDYRVSAIHIEKKQTI